MTSDEELVRRLRTLADRLEREQGAALPDDEPYLESSSAARRRIKRGIFRAVRPATRRYDRLATELAAAAAELAGRVGEIDADVGRLVERVRRLDRAMEEGGAPGGPATAGQAVIVPDDYYWRFERHMRGSDESVAERLRQYERFAVPLRESLGSESPLWLDLGCGTGELCELAREWGWRVRGVDSSPGAVEATRERGIEAELADVRGYLETIRGEAPGVISAVQVIEHLPREAWIPLFASARTALAPRGALLLETINALNVESVARYFLADVTHTWPGHPETLRLMAEHAGFERVEIVYLNVDDRGNAQDVAVWAVRD